MDDESRLDQPASLLEITKLTDDQLDAFDRIMTWWQKRPRTRVKGESYTFRLGGYAGTGKTFLMNQLAWALVDENIAWCAYTGKAGRVLAKQIPAHCSVSTIHALMYEPVLRTKEITVRQKYKDLDGIEKYRNVVQVVEYHAGFHKKESLDADLIVVDEASMVTRDIEEDLRRHGIPILYVGDHGQLPAFDYFDLMKDPDVALTTVMRQAKDNPIIAVATQIREQQNLNPDVPWLGSQEEDQDKLGAYAIRRKDIDDRIWVSSLIGVDRVDRETADGETYEARVRSGPDHALICGYNDTRVKLNTAVRNRKETTQEPFELGDALICLKNYPRRGTNYMNGTVFLATTHPVASSKGFTTNLLDETGKEFYNVEVCAHGFGRQKTIKPEDGLFRSYDDVGMVFDHGYALTAHKAQGSGFDYVTVLPEYFPMSSKEARVRWLYTAVTRARKQVVIVR